MSFRPLWAWRAAPARVRDRLSRERRPSGVAAAARAVRRRRRRRGAVLLQRCSRAQTAARVRGPGPPAARPRRAGLEGAHGHRQAGRCGARASARRAGRRGDCRVAGGTPRELAELGPGHHELAAIDSARRARLRCTSTDEAKSRDTGPEHASFRHSRFWRSSPGCSSSTRGVSTGSTSRRRRVQRPSTSSTVRQPASPGTRPM